MIPPRCQNRVIDSGTFYAKFLFKKQFLHKNIYFEFFILRASKYGQILVNFGEMSYLYSAKGNILCSGCDATKGRRLFCSCGV